MTKYDLDTFHAFDRLRDEIFRARDMGYPFDAETQTLIAALRAYRRPSADPKDFVATQPPYVPVTVGDIVDKRSGKRRKALVALAKRVRNVPVSVPKHLLPKLSRHEGLLSR